jgi:hypothetical protein
MDAVDHRPERLSAAPLTVGQVITQRRSFSQADFDRRPDKQLVNLNTLCTSPASEVVCSGEALVLVSDVTPRVKAKYFAIPQSMAAGDSRPNPSLTEEN